jgi:cytochrome c oxidase subunit 2
MFPSTTAAVNGTFLYIMAFCVALLILILFFTIFFAVRYRRSRNPVVKNIGGNWKLELVWIAAATVLVLTMFVSGLNGFRFLRKIPEGALNVEVSAAQWSWEFDYANGKKSENLVVPQGRDIGLTMRTVDVIHGFFVPVYRIKQDIVPGMTNHLWFKAKDLGTFDVLCSQYCGEEHSKMLASIFVVPPDVYEKWYAGEKVSIPGLEEDTSASP